MNDAQIAAPARSIRAEPSNGGRAPPVTASYNEALDHMKRHLGRLAMRFRVDVADIRQTLYVVWQRVARHDGPLHAETRDAFYKYLYRALENELTDTVGIHPDAPSARSAAEGTDQRRRAADPAGLPEAGEEDGVPRVPAVDEQIRNLFVRACTEAAFPEALRTHPLYEHPSCRAVLEGILDQEPIDRIAQRLGVTRRRVNAQIETIERILLQPDAGQIDRIFRALPEAQWLPAKPLTRRPIESLRYAPLENGFGGRVLKTLRRFMSLGMQPAVVYVDQFSRVLSGVDVCVAARILGVSSVATLLQVLRSSSPDLDDETYRRACEDRLQDTESAVDLIPAFRRLLQDGYLSELVGSFLHQLGKAAQFTMLRELGTGLVPLLGAREARSLLKAVREGTFQNEVRAQRGRLAARMLERPRAAPAGQVES